MLSKIYFYSDSCPVYHGPNSWVSVYIWYEFAEVGFTWPQLLPSFQAQLRDHSIAW